ncbi:DUF2752 domain-containing protein [Flagellimonas pacifica]|uniref:DUF2752 domain-containing protein n=1 Tax=Flagellimonas pacifica TaxID=1247520 RepID=A0A285MUV6_9FLAO|nr:Protein of unknown function [Allomuricauda parva]
MQAATKKKYIILVLGVLSVLAILLYFLYNPEKGLLFPKCPFNQYLGIYCSGCGSQRAIHDLLHLRIKDVLSHNLLLIPALIVILQHLAVTLDFYKGKSFLAYRYAPMTILLVIVVFMVLRNLKMYPFDFLAP